MPALLPKVASSLRSYDALEVRQAGERLPVTGPRGRTPWWHAGQLYDRHWGKGGPRSCCHRGLLAWPLLPRSGMAGERSHRVRQRASPHSVPGAQQRHSECRVTEAPGPPCSAPACDPSAAGWPLTKPVTCETWPGSMADEFYLRYYTGHQGKFGHEFLEFEFRYGKARAA